jgi:hypothetical protein
VAFDFCISDVHLICILVGAAGAPYANLSDAAEET